MHEPWIVYGLVFASAILAVEGLYWLTFGVRREKKAINRRLALGRTRTAQTEVLEVLLNERGVRAFTNPNLARFNDFFVQTGLRASKPVLAVWTVGISVVFAIVFALAFANRGAALGGVVIGPLAMLFYLKRVRAKRLQRFLSQLPDSIEIIVRGLRIGHPFSTAAELVARELPDPIGTEFGITADEMAFGQDTVTAINNLYRRVGQEDLLFLVTAVSVQTQTGGNLADVLARLATLIRERANMRLKIRALSAEGRLSGWFLTGMPFVLFLVIILLAPNYFDELKRSIFLTPAIIYGVVSVLIANFAIFRMVNFKV